MEGKPAQILSPQHQSGQLDVTAGSTVDHQVRILEGGGPGGHSPGIGAWRGWGLQSIALKREMFRASLLTPGTFDTPQPQGATVGGTVGLSNRGGAQAELSQEAVRP